jgi:Tol biopolymer transport system component
MRAAEAGCACLLVAATWPMPGAAVSRTAAMDFVTVARADRYARASDAPAVAVSPDGRFVAFSSNARLAPGDRNAASDIYVLDRLTGSVSLETPMTGEHSGSVSAPLLSASGHFLVYEALADMAGMPVRTIMLRDRLAGVTRALPGTLAPQSGSRGAQISSTGDRVTFSSSAVDLVDGVDANGSGEDVYLFDVSSGRYQRVSVDDHGRQRAVGTSFGPAMSSDGRYVAFSSSARLDDAPMASEKRSAFVNVYLRDTVGGTTIRISVAMGGAAPNGSSYYPAVSDDGRYVAFVSDATNLVKGRDANRAPDVFVRDTVRGVTQLVSRRVSGGTANGPSTQPRISSDGSILIFQSDASDMVCAARCALADRDINLVSDIFAWDRTSGAVRRISRGTGPWMEPSVGPATDASGTVVAFSSRHPRDASDNQEDFDLFVWSARPPD